MAITPAVQPPNAAMPREDYKAFMRGLNQDIQNDPVYVGKAFVIEPPAGDTQQALSEFDNRLKETAGAGIARRTDLTNAEKQHAVDALSRNVNQLVVNEKYYEGGFSQSNMDEGRISDPKYLATAVTIREGATFQDTWGKELKRELGEPGKETKVLGVASDAFQRNVSMSFLQKFTATHELGHALYGSSGEAKEAHDLYPRRNEVNSDAFAALYLIQKKEPNVANQLAAVASMRDASMAVHEQEMKHDTSPVLQRILADLPKLQSDPEFGKKSLSDLMKMADGYAHGTVREYYPDVYAGKGNETTRNDIEEQRLKFGTIQDYAYQKLSGGEWKNPEYRQAHVEMDKLEPHQAALLVRMSKAYEEVTGKRDNPLSEDVARLRKEQPETFRKADEFISTGTQPENSPVKTSAATAQEKFAGLDGVKEASALFASTAGVQAAVHAETVSIPHAPDVSRSLQGMNHA